ncbi:sugar phosphate isomerase/epimerase family protein [Rubellicoccus peritrichatus]|uniref:Sugar phosphate isomerase/epimerase family protein n=1 Tax=Rubellicoccus peritrichatus TaxID=3080537 RepID=A0AAQ3QTI1_9BACT|nr:sugar phosphate isomerase/epimerase family protein [Puniceicoccus sp. CR14]WOO39408.1 sugar phosphate isomerase/epimerase family protein [Puniceicoccus sp. CR14]
MSAQPLTSFDKLCIHTITHKPWSLREVIDNFARENVKGITVWRGDIEGGSPVEAGKMIRSRGLEIVSYCRGGFFPAKTALDRQSAIHDNERMIDEAAALGAPLIVLVCGAVPGLPLSESRRHIVDGIKAILPRAKDKGIKLAIEPLHPMYADDRSAINTMQQANDVAEEIGSDYVGVAIDVYHLWWDPRLEVEIKRCGRMKKIFAFHICDWKTPTEDILFDRGLMGEGCIDIRKIRGWVEDAGFKGYNEVEIFSNSRWEKDQADYLSEIKQAYLRHS